MLTKEKQITNESAKEIISTLQKKLDFLQLKSTIICFEVTLDGRIIFVSPAIESVSGYHPQELLNRSMWNFYLDMSDRDHLLEELLKNGRLADYPVTFKDKDQTPRNFRINAILIKDTANHPASLFGVLIPS
jgi:PAS domain S-box-containing protein